MIADVDLCREILFKYADEPCYPTQIQFKNLLGLFPDRSKSELQFNLIALKDAGLLDLKYKHQATLSGGGIVLIGSIRGLSPHKGSEFVQNARNPKLWEAAKEKCVSQIGELAIGRIFELLVNVPLG